MKLNRPLLAALATVAALGFAQGAMAQQSAAANTAGPIKNIVFVHGLYADGSSWEKVIPLLQAKGLHVTSVQYPTTSLDGGQAGPSPAGWPDAAGRAFVWRHGHHAGWR